MTHISKKIPSKDYKKILERMPVCCVDAVIIHDNKILLVYRDNEPAKDTWWLPGGRIYKGESLEHAVLRKIHEETGLKIKIEKKIGAYETMFSKGPFKNLKGGVHTISVCFLTRPVNKKPEVRLDNTSSNYRWIEKAERNLDPYVKKVIKEAKVF